MTENILTNLGLGTLVLAVCLFLLWFISLKIRDTSIIDIFWGFGFVLMALVCLWLAPVKTPYIILLAALPTIWGLRLTVYLAKRNLGHGEDRRYIAMRARSNLTEMEWRQRSFFTIFLGQGLIILIVSAPIWVALATGIGELSPVYTEMSGKTVSETKSASQIGKLSVPGVLLWMIGFLFEAIGDAQLAKFIRKNKNFDGPYKNRPVLDTGLWQYTRHPNYFGNACMWWGIWLLACQAPWGWVTIFAPLIMTILLVRVSGKDLLERQLKKRPAYQIYMDRTSGFFPMPPKKP